MQDHDLSEHYYSPYSGIVLDQSYEKGTVKITDRLVGELTIADKKKIRADF